jgi:hypothetical protein
MSVKRKEVNMSLSDKEIMLKLAEAIISSYEVYHDGAWYYCIFCGEDKDITIKHKPDCPVLLAEQVLNRCPVCNGINSSYLNHENGNGYICNLCNGTGVKK